MTQKSLYLIELLCFGVSNKVMFGGMFMHHFHDNAVIQAES